MEKYQTQHQSVNKKMKKVRIASEQQSSPGRFSWKQNFRVSNPSTIEPTKKKMNGNKFTKCIFTLKKHMLDNQNSNELSKYINHRILSGEKKKSIRQLNNPSKLTKYQSIIFEKYKSINKTQQKISQDSAKQQQQQYELNFEIKQVFKNLDILKNYGFSQKKITKWMNSYLSKKAQMVQDLFIKSFVNKKSLNDSFIYQRYTTLENISKKLHKLLATLCQSEIIFLHNEIKSFKGYIQDIVIKMTQANLDQIFNMGQINPILKLSKQTNNFTTNSEISHFFKDLKNLEDKYGELNQISKLNKTMFKQVSEAEQKFYKQFYS